MSRRSAVVVGGSLAGLSAALMLRELGYEVTALEQSPTPLVSRGAGLVLQPDVCAVLESYAGVDPLLLSTSCSVRQYLRVGGAPARQMAMPQRFTAWNAVYRALATAFGEDGVERGAQVATVDAQGARPSVETNDGERLTADLIMCADGYASATRRVLLPHVVPTYAGYVAWRGLVAESDLVPSVLEVFRDTFTFLELAEGHILAYLVPGVDGEREPGKRRVNWVWYVNVPAGPQLDDLLTGSDGLRHAVGLPPGAARPDVIQAMHQRAERELDDFFGELVRATREPFVQSIIDLSSSRMAFNRVCMIGDAAFVPRPHTAASTQKAANDVLTLHAALARHRDERAALAAWEPRQLRLGHQLAVHGQRLGNQSQLGTSGALR
jgi:2-polyprenyl-6-methoxyphenol hydroxylase-like FAD-dependent oxidoreductase